jgi:hypothetical protein
MWLLAGGEWSASRPGCYPGGKKPPYPFDRRVGELHRRSGRRGEVKILDPIRYTDCAIQAQLYICNIKSLLSGMCIMFYLKLWRRGNLKQDYGNTASFQISIRRRNNCDAIETHMRVERK